MTLDWFFGFWIPYYYTAGLLAFAVAFALRAAIVARVYHRKLLSLSLYALVGALSIASVGTANIGLPPLSPAMLLVGLSGWLVLFVLGIERVRMEDIPVPSKAELERLLNRGLKSVQMFLSEQEYELAADYIRVEQMHTGRPLSLDRIMTLTHLARNRTAH